MQFEAGCSKLAVNPGRRYARLGGALVLSLLATLACSKRAPEPSAESTTNATGLTLAERGPKPEVAFSDLQAACDAHATKYAGVNKNASGGHCTATEVALFQKDTTGNCLNCMAQRGCLDDTKGDANEECGDLGPDGITSGTEAQCVDTLRCLMGASSTSSEVHPAPAKGMAISGYCGVGRTYTDCVNTSHPAGVCVAAETAGFPPNSSVGSIVASYGKKSYASGQANTIFACAVANTCSSCLQ